jgi:hypothetical protein
LDGRPFDLERDRDLIERLAAALKAKEEAPDAVITYVRKQNKRGDRRHPHQEGNAGDIG